MTTLETKNRILKGVVVSDKMDKTVVIEILRLKKHPKYKKFYKVSKRFKAHDEENKYHVGDNVLIKETKPISKDKKWIVVDKIAAGKEKQS
ncbi:MAG: 30S ribosomal protein S17 [Candidatus Yanofskybacteria bacterium GW2011_GWF1_44_227]|uniref:Small ribosomal subunit protein uS17 n=1 Tax=Candidatus Yanofskybacteria bacterium GW2011_GWE2_40_11 TaxID=1619033 RepID=A0A0G0TQE3_9BACT|nr:MAG: 30S ribosomal protein S17 [Candidatus Yanofskybacteria bacterium GW2011_GWE1_40_10]KKR40077.1 MAG: 30S ribosomal protein S17 [Candidatus Yanofskybacteria bacterium GW2011_GWE2_40_11]KKT52859.1 MAG: 30S ribosomal protein S17 [Candidatus Yanofskybacteria bacterium GW2011_GWF1_44_227]OGN35650.1 MAG: 30S ribosomal protein S17 [Candidatus Yanofskybacteria bacterium RIFOXYA1_FULL_44_17]OGN36687.1 MAG: 30S ribosomal protein S17 [Candidatus Yanofskybacteria bacterium RIFOXYA2_FULL_45_28]OGN372